MMTPDTLIWLRSAAGQALLADLAVRDLTDATLLRELTRLRAEYPADLARAAVEQTLLRRRARVKFDYADRLFFTREALEQATSEQVAQYRARRLALHTHVSDVCCGIGADTLAMAAAGHVVTAIDHDAMRLALAAANAEVLGLEQRITFVCADVLTTPPPPVSALFCDPGRRAGGRRRFHVEQYQPPLSHILAWRTQTPALVVKLAPGVDLDELTDIQDYELEFVSLDGELKEALLWCGPLATTRRRATLLHSRSPEPDAACPTLVAQSDCPPARLTPPEQFLYEPDPAVIRAGLVAELASQLDAAQLDHTIAYLTAATAIETPFARFWRVLEWLPFSLKRLRARLRALDAGCVTVKKRGSPIDTDVLARQLSSNGTQALVVVLTRVGGKPAALICTNA